MICGILYVSKGGIVIKYYYEYKEKSGCKVGGSNLEKIEFIDNYIRLSGLDTIPTISDYKKEYWHVVLDMKGIEYLRIWSMLDEEEICIPI